MTDFLHTTLLGKRIHRIGLSNDYGLDADGLRKAFDHGLNYVWYVRGTEKVVTEPLRDACARDGLHLGLHTLSAVNVAEVAPFLRDAADRYPVGCRYASASA